MSRPRENGHYLENYRGVGQMRRPAYGGKRQLSAIDSFLRSKSLKRKYIAKDGCCLFRAVAEQVWLVQSNHWILRRHCALYIRSNKDRFKSFLTEPIESYCFRLSNSSMWGGEIELVALAELLDCHILVYSEEKGAVKTREFNPVEKSPDTKHITLAYTGSNHYDIVWKEIDERQYGFCQSILYDILYGTIFKNPGLVSAARPLSLYDTTNNPPNDLRRCSSELLKALAVNVYSNIPLELSRIERYEREYRDRSLATSLQFKVGTVCHVNCSGGVHRAEIVSISSNQIQVKILDSGRKNQQIVRIPPKNIIIDHVSTRDRMDTRKHYPKGQKTSPQVDGIAGKWEQPKTNRQSERQHKMKDGTAVNGTKTDEIFSRVSPPPPPRQKQQQQSESSYRLDTSLTSKPSPAAGAASDRSVGTKKDEPRSHIDEKPRPHIDKKSQVSSRQHQVDKKRPRSDEVPSATAPPQDFNGKVPTSHPHTNEKAERMILRPQVTEATRPRADEWNRSYTHNTRKSPVSIPPPPLETRESEPVRPATPHTEEGTRPVFPPGTGEGGAYYIHPPPTVTEHKFPSESAVYFPFMGQNPMEMFSSQNNMAAAFTEAPECEWPILNPDISNNRNLSKSNEARPSLHIDGPPPPDVTSVTAVAANAAVATAAAVNQYHQMPFLHPQYIMTELEPPLQLLRTKSLENKQQFLFEYAQKCLRFYTKHFSDMELEDSLEELLCMTLEDFIATSTQYNEREFSIATSSRANSVMTEEREATPIEPRPQQEVVSSSSPSDDLPSPPAHDATPIREVDQLIEEAPTEEEIEEDEEGYQLAQPIPQPFPHPFMFQYPMMMMAAPPYGMPPPMFMNPYPMPPMMFAARPPFYPPSIPPPLPVPESQEVIVTELEEETDPSVATPTNQTSAAAKADIKTPADFKATPTANEKCESPINGPNEKSDPPPPGQSKHNDRIVQHHHGNQGYTSKNQKHYAQSKSYRAGRQGNRKAPPTNTTNHHNDNTCT